MRDEKCTCKSTLSLFCASLIPQPWMRHPSHSPAVRCRCGKRYWSIRDDKIFDSVNGKEPPNASYTEG